MEKLELAGTYFVVIGKDENYPVNIGNSHAVIKTPL